MGIYLNPNTMGFETSLNSQIYVDKTMLLSETNHKINTQQRFMCISRPRRFGKSMAMEMLSAYYSCGQNSHTLFDNLKISNDSSYNEHMNKYNVIQINLQMFLSSTKTVDEMIYLIEQSIIGELKRKYPECSDNLPFTFILNEAYAISGLQFVILIDEWDCLFREYKNDTDSQKKYLDFLRNWMKDRNYVALAYMTGILPVKKYGTHSALNMFTEYSMTNPRSLAPYFGFTEEEVKALCEEYKMSYEETGAWYDGYELTDNRIDGDYTYRMYSPKSVVDAMLAHRFDTYWNQTETYEALRVYIQINMDGMKDAVSTMLAGQSVPVKTGGFENDMTTFANKDDVLTLLIHLGYLSYNWENKTVRIPNREVSEVYVTSVERNSEDHSC